MKGRNAKGTVKWVRGHDTERKENTGEKRASWKRLECEHRWALAVFPPAFCCVQENKIFVHVFLNK